MNTICAEELGASVNFAPRGTFSQDCGQGRKLAWAAWLNFQLCLDFLSVPLLNFFVLCSRAEVLLLWVLGLFFFFFFPVWDFFSISECTQSGEINQQVLQLCIAAPQSIWNVWVAFRNYFQKFDLLLQGKQLRSLHVRG